MIYDTIIVGAGPAGYSASIYASRYKLKNLIIGHELGGQITEAHLIENYPGYPSVSGQELMNHFKEHAEKLGAELVINEAKGIIQEKDKTFTVICENNEKYSAKSIILATGMKYRKLEIPGEAEFTGKGVSFCFVCDGMFFKDKTVGVIGGGNSATMAADYLSKVAKKVYLIYRRDVLTANPTWQEKISTNEKIIKVPNTNVIKILGENLLQKVELDNPYQGNKFLDLDGLFIEIGSVPSLTLAKSLKLETDEQGYIKVKPNQSTSLEGVFAAGDVTTESNKFRQVIAASAEGAIAAEGAYKYVHHR